MRPLPCDTLPRTVRVFLRICLTTACAGKRGRGSGAAAYAREAATEDRARREARAYHDSTRQTSNASRRKNGHACMHKAEARVEGDNTQHTPIAHNSH